MSLQQPDESDYAFQRGDMAFAEEEGRKKEREQCCKDVCAECKWDLPVSLGKEFRHELKNYRGEWYSVLCAANAIRQRAARIEPKG